MSFDFIYPPICAACDKLGNSLCEACASSLRFVGEELCDVCGQPVAGDGLCGDCRNERPPFVSHRSLFKFEDVVARLVHELKYHHGFWVISFLLAQAAIEEFRVDVIVPVPLFKKRLRSRGYNQSALIADELSKHFAVKVDKTTLVRVKDTSTQTTLTREERRRNLMEAFWIRDLKKMTGKNVLLVDDVFTTGATFSSAAQTLIKSGAASVSCFSLALTPKHRGVS